MNLKNDFLTILRGALQAVDPHEALLRLLDLETGSLLMGGTRKEALDLESFDRVFVVGTGKATASMARAVEERLGPAITGGLIIVKDGHTEKLERVRQLEASHPVPDERGLAAGRDLLGLLEDCGERDLVIALISGGGSALLPAPAEGITLEEKRAVTELLLRSGASIGEMNAVRKHLSRAKGGLLARAAFPATVLNFMVSDVVGDDVGIIASGPFSPDRSTFADARAVLERYGIAEKTPASVLLRFADGVAGRIEETPKPGDAAFERVRQFIIASNLHALSGARDAAARLGYHPLILSSMIEGDTADAARWHCSIAREILSSGNPVPRPACIISGGETTVRVLGSGLGGRNMEFALIAAGEIEGLEGVLVGSAGTDGTDGPTDAAGAMADGSTIARAREAGMDHADYILRNDSYHFFEALGDLVTTGPTGTNVMDVRIMLVV